MDGQKPHTKPFCSPTIWAKRHCGLAVERVRHCSTCRLHGGPSYFVGNTVGAGLHPVTMLAAVFDLKSSIRLAFGAHVRDFPESLLCDDSKGTVGLKSLPALEGSACVPPVYGKYVSVNCVCDARRATPDERRRPSVVSVTASPLSVREVKTIPPHMWSRCRHNSPHGNLSFRCHACAIDSNARHPTDVVATKVRGASPCFASACPSNQPP